jgi:ribosomal protein L7Ae-like RNA K-turn-binding protein
MPYKKIHKNLKPDTGAENPEQKALTILQFARKAGKLIYGAEACKKGLEHGNIRLLLLTKDIAGNSKDKMMTALDNAIIQIPVKQFSSQEELSSALGLPWTCIVGILDNHFAAKILEYLSN